MDTLSDKVDIQGLPPYVESWAVAKVAGFVPAILKRWLRSHPDLPTQLQFTESVNYGRSRQRSIPDTGPPNNKRPPMPARLRG